MYIEFSETNKFSHIFLDYISQKELLKDFYGHFPNIENFEKQILLKQNFSITNREVIQKTLEKQYQNIENIPQNNIDLLAQKSTFTITTGHQLNLFTGPLYFIYKIATVINLSKTLKEKYPEYNFVPLYWMASEDHDFAEINFFHLFGKKYIWESEQSGAVGRMNPQEIMQVLGELPEEIPFITEAYTNSETLADATRKIVHHLFGNQGLLVLDADDRDLKSLFKETMHDDLVNHHANDSVKEKSEKLKNLGYKDQVFPRKINLFYLEKGKRNRIVKENGEYTVLNTSHKFSENEILDLLNNFPERFSPNVVLRPLYQETILPNLAYIGGPGELAYWLQLKDVFGFYETTFPILLPRNFALLIDKNSNKKLDKLQVTPKELFLDENKLKDLILDKQSENEFELVFEKQNLKKLFENIVQKVENIDLTLKSWVGAEEKKAQKSLDNIEKRLKKVEEQKLETNIKQVQKIKKKLFPEGSLQERHDNFLNFYLNDINFINMILTSFTPFTLKMYILSQ